MEPTATWSGLEIMKLVFSILTPVAIAILAYYANRNLHKLHLDRNQELNEKQRLREEENRRIEQNEQKALDELERKYKPHIEFDINCNFFGPHQGKYAAEFILTANNKGITKHKFTSIILRVHGIRHDKPLSFWTKRYKHRLEFPEDILEDEVISENWNYIFVEPGVTQRISYVTIIDEKIKYITAIAAFNYKKYRPHSTAKMFDVRSQNLPDTDVK